MRNLWRVSLGLALLAYAVAPALAQRPMGGGFGPGSLLTNKSVQEELKVTDDQKKKIEEVAKKANEAYSEKVKGLNFREDREKFAAAMKEATTALDKQLPDVLKEDQVKRFKQIRTQQLRNRAFSDADIQTALKFSDAQKDSIKKISEEARKSVEEKTKDLDRRRDFQKINEIRQAVDKESKEKINATLTSDQKKAWKEMVGEPFEVKFEFRRPGGGGGGRRPQPRPDLSK